MSKSLGEIIGKRAVTRTVTPHGFTEKVKVNVTIDFSTADDDQLINAIVSHFVIRGQNGSWRDLTPDEIAEKVDNKTFTVQTIGKSLKKGVKIDPEKMTPEQAAELVEQLKQRYEI